MQRKLGRGVAVVGVGKSQFGMFADRDSKDLFAEVFTRMLASVDKGIDPKDIEALYLGNFSNDFFARQAHWGPLASDVIGLVPRAATRTEGACASVEVDRLDLPKELSMHEFHADGPHPLDAVDVIIAGSFGEGFATRIAARGIFAVATDLTDPIEAVKEYLARLQSGGEPPAGMACGCGHGHGHRHRHAHAHGHRHGAEYGSGRAGLHRGYRILDAAIPDGEKSNE